MDNRKCIYFVEGECEEKMLNALKVIPSLIINGKVKKFNAITEELTNSKLITISPGSRVVFVFDTDVVLTTHLKNNIEFLKTKCSRIEVLTIPQVSNFEDEIKNSTDVTKAQDFTKSKTVDDFKKSVNKMKPAEFRNALQRHKFDIKVLWTKKPPKSFSFVSQDGDKIKK